jgi:hypothetical protein
MKHFKLNIYLSTFLLSQSLCDMPTSYNSYNDALSEGQLNITSPYDRTLSGKHGWLNVQILSERLGSYHQLDLLSDHRIFVPGRMSQPLEQPLHFERISFGSKHNLNPLMNIELAADIVNESIPDDTYYLFTLRGDFDITEDTLKSTFDGMRLTPTVKHAALDQKQQYINVNAEVNSLYGDLSLGYLQLTQGDVDIGESLHGSIEIPVTSAIFKGSFIYTTDANDESKDQTIFSFGVNKHFVVSEQFKLSPYAQLITTSSDDSALTQDGFEIGSTIFLTQHFPQTVSGRVNLSYTHLNNSNDVQEETFDVNVASSMKLSSLGAGHINYQTSLVYQESSLHLESQTYEAHIDIPYITAYFQQDSFENKTNPLLQESTSYGATYSHAMNDTIAINAGYGHIKIKHDGVEISKKDIFKIGSKSSF